MRRPRRRTEVDGLVRLNGARNLSVLTRCRDVWEEEEHRFSSRDAPEMNRIKCGGKKNQMGERERRGEGWIRRGEPDIHTPDPTLVVGDQFSICYTDRFTDLGKWKPIYSFFWGWGGGLGCVMNTFCSQLRQKQINEFRSLNDQWVYMHTVIYLSVQRLRQRDLNNKPRTWLE